MSEHFDVGMIKTMAERLSTRKITVEDALCRLKQDVPLWAELALIRSSEEVLREINDEAIKQGYGDLVDELRGTSCWVSNTKVGHDSSLPEDPSFDIFVSCNLRVNKELGTYKIYFYDSETMRIRTYDSYEEWVEDEDSCPNGYKIYNSIFMKDSKVYKRSFSKGLDSSS